jgi:acyl-CoA thioester hydrolase
MNPRAVAANDALPPIGLVVSSHCSFFSPLSFPQTLDVGLKVVKLGRSSVEYEVGVFAEGDEVASAVGGYVHVFVDRNSRKPLSGGIDGALRRGLEEIRVEQVSGLKRGDAAKL